MPVHSLRSLATRRDFDLVFEEGTSAAAKHIVLYARPNNLAYNRLGLAVSKKLGKAVVRNRVKRLLREAVRHTLGEVLRHYDLVIIARKGAADANFRQFIIELEEAWRKVTKGTHEIFSHRNSQNV